MLIRCDNARTHMSKSKSRHSESVPAPSEPHRTFHLSAIHLLTPKNAPSPLTTSKLPGGVAGPRRAHIARVAASAVYYSCSCGPSSVTNVWPGGSKIHLMVGIRLIIKTVRLNHHRQRRKCDSFWLNFLRVIELHGFVVLRLIYEPTGDNKHVPAKVKLDIKRRGAPQTDTMHPF